MNTTSPRTLVRDAIAAALTAVQKGGEARAPEYAVSLRYLTEQECNGKTTYCVVITDETATRQTMQKDQWDMTALVVLYAYDTKDPRAKLDAAIEDVIEALVPLTETLRSVVSALALTEVTTDEGTTAAGPWAQAVLRWRLSHQRRAVAA